MVKELWINATCTDYQKFGETLRFPKFKFFCRACLKKFKEIKDKEDIANEIKNKRQL